MSDSHSPAGASTPFAPRAFVPVTVGHTAVNLYPVINQSMPPHERAHAFHINVTALSSQSIDLRAQLDALGHQLNLSATVDGVIQYWLHHFYDRWSNFSHLSILGFHNTKGTQAIDTTDAADAAILLPVVDGAVTDCCKNVKSVRVQLSISFLDLVTVANLGPTTLRTEYYIELPQTSKPMTNGAGAAYNFTTFHGTADLCTLTEEQVRAEILDFTLQDGPVELQPTSFGITSARTDSLALRAEIESKISCLAYKTICNTLFIELCPGYSNQPHAALVHIHQVHSDRDGNSVVSSVQSFYQQLMSASRPYPSQCDYPVSVCACFQDGLDPHLVTGFCRLFPQHSTVQSLNATHQRKTLQEMLQAAQHAKDGFLTVTCVACEAVGLSQAFSATTTGGVGNQAMSGAYPSHAKTTLTRYSGSGGYSTDGSSGSTAASAVAGLIRGLSFAIASTW
jgi:glycine cleavage system regulatory protein